MDIEIKIYKKSKNQSKRKGRNRNVRNKTFLLKKCNFIDTFPNGIEFTSDVCNVINVTFEYSTEKEK